MQNNFNACLAFTLTQEGGFTTSLNDGSIATNKGITLATMRAYRPGSSIDDLRNIADDLVESIYRAGYWEHVLGDSLPTGVDLIIFDMAVNSGPARSAMILQGCLGTAQDGVIGPHTMAQILDNDPAKLVNRVTMAQEAFYRSLATFPTFGRGWSARVEARRVAALAMISPIVAATVAPIVSPTVAAPSSPTSSGSWGKFW